MIKRLRVIYSLKKSISNLILKQDKSEIENIKLILKSIIK